DVRAFLCLRLTRYWVIPYGTTVLSVISKKSGLPVHWITRRRVHDYIQEEAKRDENFTIPHCGAYAKYVQWKYERDYRDWRRYELLEAVRRYSLEQQLLLYGNTKFANEFQRIIRWNRVVTQKFELPIYQ